jgi:hypothetical protein
MATATPHGYTDIGEKSGGSHALEVRKTLETVLWRMELPTIATTGTDISERIGKSHALELRKIKEQYSWLQSRGEIGGYCV